MRRRFTTGAVIALALASSAIAGDWPQWRGPDGSGVATDARPPIHWSAERNLLWRAALPGAGTSTPVVWGDRVFVTCQVGDSPVRSSYRGGKVASADAAGATFVVLALGRADGRPLWRHELPAQGGLTPVHRMHNLASPSPATDGRRVVAWFGTGQIVALDLDGKPLWQRNLARDYSPYELLWGHASSPLLHGDRVFLLADHDPAAYLLALDASTGKTLWKVDRGQGLRSYSTPIIVDAGTRQELVVNSNPGIDAYDPATGKHLWRAGERNRVPVPVPVAAHGVIYASRGYTSGPYLAVRAGPATDDADDRVLWRVPTGAPYVASPLLYQGLIFLASERGLVRAVEPADGETVWTARLGGKYWASPVAASGRIYLVGEQGETVVLAAGREPKILARNSLPGDFLASPAVAGRQLFLRSYDEVFCVGESRDPAE